MAENEKGEGGKSKSSLPSLEEDDDIDSDDDDDGSDNSEERNKDENNNDKDLKVEEKVDQEELEQKATNVEFGFQEIDFDHIQKRRDRAKQAKSVLKTSILLGMTKENLARLARDDDDDELDEKKAVPSGSLDGKGVDGKLPQQTGSTTTSTDGHGSSSHTKIDWKHNIVRPKLKDGENGALKGDLSSVVAAVLSNSSNNNSATGPAQLNGKTTTTTTSSSLWSKLGAAAYGAKENELIEKNQSIIEDVIYEEAVIETKPIVLENGKQTIALWPYDDYHEVQKEFYVTKIQQQKEEEKKLRSKKKKNSAKQQQQQTKKKHFHYYYKNNNDEKDMLSVNYNFHRQQQYNTIPLFYRTPDPPDLSQHVYCLNLSLFEEVAVERSIAIVSTWLFDVGLIDELHTNAGATSGLATVATVATVSESDNGETEPSGDGGTKRNLRDKKKGRKGRVTISDNGDDGAMHDDDDDESVSDKRGKDRGTENDDLLPSEVEQTKMDREIAKLRASTKRALALVNSRLKDGVVATGSEVEALVNAVVATKDDIGRLRDLSSYVYNAGDVEQSSQQFMLTKYPKLKQAINARRNLGRVFRELEFFSHIPITCDRLREELHAGEWTANEWNSLRSVSREHVDLEIFLVEAEAAMKKRMEEEEAELQAQLAAKEKRGDRKGQKAGNNPNFGRNGYNNPTLPNSSSYALIDRFLEAHIKNVWEMGNEISIRIMNGIGSAFELAMVNPAGMVALVEAVEVYEAANADYKAVHGEEAGKRNNKLQFTDMRAAALAELYRDFDARCSDVFNELMAQSSDIAKDNDDEDASNKQFSAILRAANELGSEILVVKEKMEPCFPPSWAITTLWTTCVAHVCSNNILQQIGGTDGQNLPDLSLKQLLDLVAWVETFRQTMNEIFPDLAKITASKRNYLDKPPDLLVKDSKTIDVALAQDSLVWVNTTLWNIHNIAKEEFLFKTKEMAELWLDRGYGAEREVTQTSDGKYRTPFAEDVYTMTSIHLRTIRERLTRQSEALVQAVVVIFRILFDKQTKCRDLFCTDFQSCCAAANDFLRMSDKCEDMIEEIKNECKLSSKASEVLDEQSAALLGLYSSDAVHATKKTQTFCIKVVDEEVFEDLFTTLWEQEHTQNELATTMVRTLDECLQDLETFLDELMISKAAEAQIASIVNFYVKALLRKGSMHNNSKKSMFIDNEMAIQQMKDDAQVLRSYFEEIAEEIPTLTKLIEEEFDILDTVFTILAIAGGLTTTELKPHVINLHKRIKNPMITKFVIGDLYHIINPAEERGIYETFEAMEESLNTMMGGDKTPTAQQAAERSNAPGIRLDQVLASWIEEDTRKRPMKTEAVKKAEEALRGFGFFAKKKTDEQSGDTATTIDTETNAESNN